MKFRNPSFKVFLNGRTDTRTDKPKALCSPIFQKNFFIYFVFGRGGRVGGVRVGGVGLGGSGWGGRVWGGQGEGGVGLGGGQGGGVGLGGSG